LLYFQTANIDAAKYMLYISDITYTRRGPMPITISTADARNNFADIVNRVAYGQEPVVLTRRGQKIAALVSMEELELLQHIEDHIDIRDARQALAEPGDNIPAQEVWQQLGL